MSRGLACSACWDRATILRKGKPCCRSCARLSPFKWESALDEARRIEASKNERR